MWSRSSGREAIVVGVGGSGLSMVADGPRGNRIPPSPTRMCVWSGRHVWLGPTGSGQQGGGGSPPPQVQQLPLRHTIIRLIVGARQPLSAEYKREDGSMERGCYLLFSVEPFSFPKISCFIVFPCTFSSSPHPCTPMAKWEPLEVTEAVIRKTEEDELASKEVFVVG